MTLKEQDQKEIMEKLIVLTDKDKLKWEFSSEVEDQGNSNYIMQQYFKAAQMIKNGDIILFLLDLSKKELGIVKSYPMYSRTIAIITATQDLINSVLLNNEKQREQAYKEDVEQIKNILYEMESEE